MMINLEARIMKLEEQTQWMHNRMVETMASNEFLGGAKMTGMNGRGGTEVGGFG